MKNIYFLLLISTFCFASCNSDSKTNETNNSTENPSTEATGQSGVKDDDSSPNVVQVAVASKDHSTLVAAVKAAGLVDALSNAGPFTVFAPTNAAFDKLPKGTVEGLLEPDKKADLKNLLEYHTYVGVLKTDYMNDGDTFEQVNGQLIKITKKGDKYFVNGTAEIVASIPTSNGIIHVLSEVLSPPTK
jgi:uncharacterized surface protein with fasciclin (FAS1) repeats